MYIALKTRDITLPAKDHLVKAMVLPVVMYGCKSWTIKKTEHQRIHPFELWCWRRLWGVPWTARRSNQSILKEIGPEYSLKGLMLKLKLQSLATWCEELTHWKRPWCWEKNWGQEEKGMTEDEMVRWHHRLDEHEFEQTLRDSGRQKHSILQCMVMQRIRHNLGTEPMSPTLQGGFLTAGPPGKSQS